MEVVIAGCRDYYNYYTLEQAIQDSGFDITLIISGGASGVDALGIEYAKKHSIPYRVYKADWKRHGRAAGPIRNQLMVDDAEAVIAIWDGQSKGTKSTIDMTKRAGKPLHVHIVSTSSLSGDN